MIALIQRVLHAAVAVEGQTIGSIDQGLLALIGIEPHDNEESGTRLINKVTHYRVFSDDKGRMNRSLLETHGELLLVSQFTLLADTQKGTRPSFSKAASPEVAEPLFKYVVTSARACVARVQTGKFGADMQVHLVNDGPVTFWLQA